MSKEMIIGVLTASDRASQDVYEDISGPAIETLLGELLLSPWRVSRRVVPDGIESVREALVTMADHDGCGLVLTTGGTGPSPRDLTPEATLAVLDKEMPGFGEAMRTASLAEVPTAILSRQTAGIRGRTLIINLPGKPASIRTNLLAVFGAVPYCLELIGAGWIDTNPALCLPFRPRQEAATR